MKPIILSALVFCLMQFACTPKNEEVTEEQIEVGPAEEVIDTIANTKKDALKTDENNITPIFPLPQPVLQLLSQQYPGQQELTFTEGVLQRAEDNTQGPGIVRGDFNGDNLQDYAVQLQQNKQLVIVVAMNGANDNWQLYEIKKDILFNDRGTLKSPYLLRLTQAGTELEHQTTQKEITTPYDAVTVSLDGNDTAYLYENGKFEGYNTGE